jgi:protocatechuate 3,4-dioxygenase beta subunit
MATKTPVALVLAICVAIGLVARCGRHDPPPALPATSAHHLSAAVAAGALIEASTAAIDGRVVDDDNAPITGVKVCALTPTPACAISDTSGAFAIANLAVADARELDLAAQRAHYVVAAQHRAETSTAQHAEVLIAMKSGGAMLDGFVRDAGGGSVAHAFVTSGESIAEADDDGHYALWLEPTSASVSATADGYAIDRHTVQPPGHLDFALVPEATVGGQVVDATTGRAMPHMRVTATTDSTTIAATAATDDDGRFRLRKLSPAQYDLGVDDPHAVAAHAGLVPVALGAHVDGIVVRVLPAFALSGRVVTDSTGTPCTSGTVALTPEHGAWTPTQVTGAGEIHAGGLLPGTYRVDVWCDHHLAVDRYDNVVVANRDLVDQRWQVTTGATITGRVLDEHGAPVAGAHVYGDQVATSGSARRSSDAVLAATDGSFSITGLRPGTYLVSAASPYGSIDERDRAVVDVASDGAAHHDFVIDASASVITGHVLFADGTPARNIDVLFKQASGEQSFGVATDETGGFWMACPPGGDYRITIATHDTPLPITGADATGLAVHLVPASVNAFELTTPAVTGEIRGRVVDDRGQPVDDAFVSFQAFDAQDPDASFGVDSEVMVGPDGSFRAEHLPGPSYVVRAYRKSGGETIARPVAVGASVTLTLATTGSIAGIVRLAGAPVQRFEAILEKLPGGEVQTLDAFSLDGRFALHGVVPGHYRVLVTGDDGGSQVEVDVGAGQDAAVELALDPPAHVRGRVVEQTTGRPLGFILVSPHQRGVADVYTDDDGRFDLVVTIRGPLSIELEAARDLVHSNWYGVMTKQVTIDSDSIDLGTIPLALAE